MGLSNSGDGDSANITATIALPAGLTFATPVSGAGPLEVAPRGALAAYMRFSLEGSFSVDDWNCSLSDDSTVATCELPSLGAGDATTLDLDLDPVDDVDLASDAETAFSVTSGEQSVSYSVRTGLEDNEENLHAIYSTEGHVAAQHVGATLLGCDTDTTECRNAMKSVGHAKDASYNNEYWDMRPLNEAGGVTNSAATNLNLPDGAKVTYALLEWSANRGPEDEFEGDQASAWLKVPGTTEYTAISADSVEAATDDSGDVYYRSRVDVTDLVNASGSGSWALADIALVDQEAMSHGKNYYAGFALTVVYEDPSLANSRVALFDGAQWISSEYAADVQFATSGSANVVVGMTAWEGDRVLPLPNVAEASNRVEVDDESFRPRRWNGKNSPADGESDNAADSTAFGGDYANTFGVDAKLFHDAAVTSGVHAVKVSAAGDDFLLSTLSITITGES